MIAIGHLLGAHTAHIRTGAEGALPQTLSQVVSEYSDPKLEIGPPQIAKAREMLILRRDTLDSLAEPRVRRVIGSILSSRLFPLETQIDDIQLVLDLGLVRRGPEGLEIANENYRDVIPRLLDSLPQLQGIANQGYELVFTSQPRGPS